MVALVVMEQVAIAELTKQEVEPENDPAAIKFELVYMTRDDPIDVVKLGVTVKVIELVDDIIEVSLLGYSPFPVNPVMKVVGTTVVIADTVDPYIIGFPKFAN